MHCVSRINNTDHHYEKNTDVILAWIPPSQLRWLGLVAVMIKPPHYECQEIVSLPYVTNC